MDWFLVLNLMDWWGSSTLARRLRENCPIAKKIWLLSTQGMLVVKCPPVRTTEKPIWKCHTFQLVWERTTWYCTSILRSIDSCQNRVSVDQYDMTISQAQVSTHQGYLFFFFCYPLTSQYFSFDRSLNWKWISLQWLQVLNCERFEPRSHFISRLSRIYCSNKFIVWRRLYGSYAFSLG